MIKKIGITLGILFLLALLYFVQNCLHEGDIWPFRLERHTQLIELKNSGKIRIESVEQVGFDSPGYIHKAFYEPPGAGMPELFTEWSGHATSHKIQIYFTGVLMIIPNPSGDSLSVRTAEMKWKSFSFHYPFEAGGTLPLKFYSEPTGLSEDDLYTLIKLRQAGYAISAHFKAFDPQTRILTVNFWSKEEREVLLQLSEDGKSLKLKHIGETLRYVPQPRH